MYLSGPDDGNLYSQDKENQKAGQEEKSIRGPENHPTKQGRQE
jgi:hypothetical protein